MQGQGWDDFHRRWAGLKPPLRPAASVVDAIGGRIAGREGHVLLLGMTPELAHIGDTTTAIDWSEQAIARIWKGDDERRRALRADWRAMPLARASATAAIGDGSFNVLPFADYPALFGELARVTEAGGRIAIRCYLTPERCESPSELRDVVMAGGIGFHAFKWRLAMALAAGRGDPDVTMADIHHMFELLFPDRADLARSGGWSLAQIGEIDAYRGSAARLSFPTAAQMLASVPETFADAGLADVGGYELAERCPLLIARRCS